MRILATITSSVNFYQLCTDMIYKLESIIIIVIIMIDHFKTTLGLKEADKKVFKRKPMHFRSKILLQETKVFNKKIKTLCETIYHCCE